ncbi:MAG: hypothetical protein H8E44_22410 [Planctomycetes bacterium]|nr:hypothetical protein [Planctomycetota bacterium]MBL7040408.1 hypothetical protein [Pirellulaceae bacterium]
MWFEAKGKGRTKLTKQVGFVCALGAAFGCLFPVQHALARRPKATQNTADSAVTRPSFAHLSKQQLLEKIDSHEREMADLWSRYIDAQSRAIAAIAVTRPWTNCPTPPGPPVMRYAPGPNGHVISPLYLAPGKVFQMSEASLVYRRTMWAIARNQALAVSIRWRMLCLLNEISVLESELHNRFSE